MLSDLRHTLRTLAKSPGFVAVAVFTLTLGIGVNTAMFSIVNAILLRPMPFGESERLFAIQLMKPGDNRRYGAMSPDELKDLRAAQRSFEGFSSQASGTVNISSPGAEPERVNGCTMSAAGAALLRVPPAQGRWWTADEDKPGAAPTVVIGYALWENRFHSDPAILGQPLKINGEWATIIGVAAKGFRFPAESDLWKPLRYARTDARRDDRGLAVFGRLKPGVTPAQAGADLAAVGRRWAAEYPDTNKELELSLRPFRERFVDDGMRRMITIMFGAVLLVLLIACANVANLLLARAAGRQKELAVRVALGAGRGRIVRLLLAESLLLSVAGAVGGLLVAHGLVALLVRHLAAKHPPYWMVFDLDAAGLGYVVALAVFTCLAAGLWPAWRAGRPDLNSVLKDSGRGATGFSLSKFTRVMVVVEVALSCVLLVLSGLTVRSVIKMQLTPLGYETAGVFTSRIALPEAGYKEATKQWQFYRQLLERLQARPEIAAAALSDLQPTWGDRTQIEFEGKPRGGPHGSGLPAQFASRATVSGNYFATLGIKLAQGRTFDERDTSDVTRAAIVSTRFAERHWPGESALGKRFVYGWGLNVKPDDWFAVVGVVAPTLQGEFEEDMTNTPQTYVPYTQAQGVRYTTLYVKARNGEAAALASVVRQTVRNLDDELPIYYVQTLDAMVADAKFFKQLFAWMFGLFGGVALVLAGVGLYGVMSYSVSQRTQEIGVRMALGAEPGDVLAMILREGGLRLTAGLGLGLVAAYFAGRLLASFLFGVEPGDGWAFGATLLTLGAAGFVACLVPALRAVRVNPVEALRCE